MPRCTHTVRGNIWGAGSHSLVGHDDLGPGRRRCVAFVKHYTTRNVTFRSIFALWALRQGMQRGRGAVLVVEEMGHLLHGVHASDDDQLVGRVGLSDLATARGTLGEYDNLAPNHAVPGVVAEGHMAQMMR